LNGNVEAKLSPKQIRARLDMSLSQIYILLKEGEDPIPHYKIGCAYRISEKEFERWLERRHHAKID